MTKRLSNLNEAETRRLKEVLTAAWAVPFVDDIGDFIWEAAFHYVKGLPIPDPLEGGQSKMLFDAVDTDTGRGWSLKALLLKRKSLPPAGYRFEFVIQRASIMKKAKAKKGRAKVQMEVTAEDTPTEVIEQELSINSPEDDIGRALINFWNNKVKKDMKAQSVTDGRLSVLLKNANRREYVLIEESIPIFKPTELEWSWTDADRVGFQARNKEGNVVLKWYHGQTQLFQIMTIPADATRVEITPRRMDSERFVAEVLKLLPPQIIGKQRT